MQLPKDVDLSLPLAVTTLTDSLGSSLGAPDRTLVEAGTQCNELRTVLMAAVSPTYLIVVTSDGGRHTAIASVGVHLVANRSIPEKVIRDLSQCRVNNIN